MAKKKTVTDECVAECKDECATECTEPKKAAKKSSYCVCDCSGETVREYPNKADADSYAAKIGGEVK